VLASQLLPDRTCVGCTRQVEWGCESDAALPQFQLDDEVLYRCPVRGFLEDPNGFNHLFSAYRWAKNGHFPDPGTWLDQPSGFMEAIDLIDRALEEASEEDKRRQKYRQAAAAAASAAAPKKPAAAHSNYVKGQ